jgi:hypothetical protein
MASRCRRRGPTCQDSPYARTAAVPTSNPSVLGEHTWGDSCDDVLRMAELPRKLWKQCHVPRQDIVVPPAQHESPQDPPPFFVTQDPGMARLR